MNTKKLKTMVTAILLLCTVSSFAQTKEETLEWLNQNNGYCAISWRFSQGTDVNYYYTFYEDYIIREYNLDYELYASYKIYYKDILLQDISKLDESNNSKTNPPITYLEIPISKYYYRGKSDVSYEENDANRLSFSYETDQPNARKKLEKVLRAIMHMAKLHDAEPYKDLFGE